MAQQDDEIEVFWREEEEKLGEKILKRALVHVVQSDHSDIPDDSWCLGMLTDSRFILQGGESDNWFTQMLAQRNRKKKADPRLELGRDILLEPEKITPSGFLARFLNPTRMFRLRWNAGTETPGMTVELDSSGEDFILSLP